MCEALTQKREDGVGVDNTADVEGIQANNPEASSERKEAGGQGVTELAVLGRDGGLRVVDWVTTGSNSALDVSGAALLEVSSAEVDGGLVVLRSGGHAGCATGRYGEQMGVF